MWKDVPCKFRVMQGFMRRGITVDRPRMMREGKCIRVANYVLEQKLGRPLGPGKLACHICDDHRCIEPQHLYEGTRSDNMLDYTRRKAR